MQPIAKGNVARTRGKKEADEQVGVFIIGDGLVAAGFAFLALEVEAH
jgi:deoxyxylulose-5-phosphate synthase